MRMCARLLPLRRLHVRACARVVGHFAYACCVPALRAPYALHGCSSSLALATRVELSQSSSEATADRSQDVCIATWSEIASIVLLDRGETHVGGCMSLEHIADSSIVTRRNVEGTGERCCVSAV
eukprot:5767207-Pleurochrysis_carterae.AAC.1